MMSVKEGTKTAFRYTAIGGGILAVASGGYALVTMKKADLTLKNIAPALITVVVGLASASYGMMNAPVTVKTVTEKKTDTVTEKV